MKVKALILSFVFLFGGSGFSIDILKCCSSISAISVGLKGQKDIEKDCCSKIIPISKKSCCSDMVFHTVINSVPGIVKTTVSIFKAQQSNDLTSLMQLGISLSYAVQSNIESVDFDHQYPIPILLQKRVLRI